jgi:hypothetical protein
MWPNPRAFLKYAIQNCSYQDNSRRQAPSFRRLPSDVRMLTQTPNAILFYAFAKKAA